MLTQAEKVRLLMRIMDKALEKDQEKEKLLNWIDCV
jgi:hypothetical protein